MSKISPACWAECPWTTLQEHRGEDGHPVGGRKVEEESGDAARREHAIAPEEAEVKDRVLHPVLDENERRQPRRPPRHRRPIVRAFAHPQSGEKIKGTNKAASITPRRAAPRVSMRPLLTLRPRSHALGRSVPALGAEEIPARHEGGDRDRDVHQEDPAPAEMGRDEAAQGRTKDEADGGEHDVETERPPPLFGREGRGHDGGARGEEQRAAHSLKDLWPRRERGHWARARPPPRKGRRGGPPACRGARGRACRPSARRG